MCLKSKTLLIRIAVALLTFSTSVVLTILLIMPSSQSVINPTFPMSSNSKNHQQTVLPDSWKQLRVREKVALRVPSDMKPIEPFGEYLRHVQAYGNKDLSIMIFSELLVAEAMSESQKRQLYSCERESSVIGHPSYRESTVEIDGKKATIGISRSVREAFVADICFPVADNVKMPLRIVAFCTDDRALESAHQIFRSITFTE